MRIASRIVGILLALAGLGFLAAGFVVLLFGFRSHSVLSEPNKSVWIGLAVWLGAGVWFVAEGRNFFKLDVDAPDETQEHTVTRPDAYFIAHRRELTIVAQAGLVVSLIRLGAAGFGMDWPGLWASWAITVAFMGLLFIWLRIAKAKRDEPQQWEAAPEPLRHVLTAYNKLSGTALFVLLILLAWYQWSQHQVPRPLQYGFAPLFFAWEALSFAYGQTRDTTGEKS